MNDATKAAYGGPGWSPRTRSLHQELGSIWRACGVDSEWQTLTDVLLHRPGREFDRIEDVNAAQMLEPIDGDLARAQHDALAEAYRAAGVSVHYVEPASPSHPNQVFVADLMFMTPEGAIVARPASTVRAGEEVWAARRLATLTVPILLTVHGSGTFEGADAMWLDRRHLLLATGLRTNPEGARQVASLLHGLGVDVIPVELPPGNMHLMGALRIVAPDTAVVWPGRLPPSTCDRLTQMGFRLLELPDQTEAAHGMALNFVVLGPRRVIMAAGNPRTQSMLERAGIDCTPIDISELVKGAGGIACMTGVLGRTVGRAETR